MWYQSKPHQTSSEVVDCHHIIPLLLPLVGGMDISPRLLMVVVGVEVGVDSRLCNPQSI